MRTLKRLWKTFYEFISEDFPDLVVDMWVWIVGETWVEFGLRVTFLCFLIFVLRSLWQKLSDISDRSPLATVAGLAALLVLIISALGAYFAGFWRAPSWLP